MTPETDESRAGQELGARHSVAAYVQKIRVPVRLSQPNQAPRDGWFLLSPRTDGANRPESVVELLNSALTAIPFIAPDDDGVLLLTRVTQARVRVFTFTGAG